MKELLKQLIIEADHEFKPALSHSINIDDYVDKLTSKAAIIFMFDDEGILQAFIAFYCNDFETHIGYLSMIIVKKDYRNKGVAQLLVEAAETYIKNVGLHYFKLEVFKQNTGAMNLYSKLGFVTVEEKEHAFIMQKNLE